MVVSLIKNLPVGFVPCPVDGHQELSVAFGRHFSSQKIAV
jgi:hypothetical protein